MRRGPALLALGGLFLIGVVSGGLGAHLYYARSLERPPGPPPFFGGGMGARLEHHLDLTPEQRLRVRQILEESRREAEALRGELAPRIRAVMERSEARIDELLTPEQRERFAELRRRHRHRSERFFGGHGGRRRPRPDDG